MRNVKNLTLCVLVLALVSAAAADTHYVPSEYDTIQAAIDEVDSGDQIEVAGGTYLEAINFNGKAVRLYSSTPGAATIDATGLNCSVVTCNSGEGTDTILEGFVVTGGNAVNGGGMYNSGSSPTVTNCTFTGNSATGGLVTTWEPGLWYGTLTGNINTTDANPQTSVTWDLHETEDNYLPENTTEVYTGQIFVSTSGTTCFTEYNDDKTRLYIDLNQNGDFEEGELVLNDDNWNIPTYGDVTLMAGLWYDFELRMSNGDGPGGVVEGLCFGYRLPGGDLVHPENTDAFTADLFRHTVMTGAESKGGGMYNINSSPTVTGCTFESNSAQQAGGMYNDDGSNPTISDCDFTGNSAEGSGGGMRNVESDPILTNCTFTGNSGYYAGGLSSIRSNPTLTNCSFISNVATVAGGGMGTYYGDPELTNCTFTGNSAKNGGGVNFEHSYGPILTNCTFTGNSADCGGGLNNWDSTPTTTGCTFSSNTAGTSGGGIASDENSSPTVTECTFSENLASNGGGMYNGGGNPTVTNCIFSLNLATYAGGAISNDQSSPTVDACTFSGNQANYGGGMHNWGSSPTVTDCEFSENQAFSDSGGMHNCYDSSPTVTNCTFTGNHAAGQGGAMVNYSGGSPTLTNCTFSGNLATNFGGGMTTFDSSPTVTNCILWANGAPTGPQIYGDPATVTYSDVQGGYSGTGNIDEDPLFGPGTLRLSAGSPCIDAGNNDAVPAGVTTDLAGNPRFVDDPATSDTGSGTGPIVDMGAFEFQPGPIHNITQDLWYGTIQSAIDYSNDYDQIEVGPGTYYEAIDFNGRAIRLYSSAGADETTIDGGGAYHVVQCVSGEGSDTILQGFTITGGNADSESWPNERGGGMYNQGTSPTVINCIFTDNYAAGYGGGMSNFYSNPTVTGCTFEGNSANRFGGMHNDGSDPTVTDCTFSSNTSDTSGGGMGNTNSSPILTNCIFIENSAVDSAGLSSLESNPTLADCSFINNHAAWGGGGMGTRNGQPILTNCTFTGNSASDHGGGMHNYLSSPILTNCTFNANSAKNGGGVNYEESYDAILTNCTFTANSANLRGGGMRNDRSSPTVTNCTFTANSAGSRGGGMGNFPDSSPTVTNCTFSDNMAMADGGGMWNAVGSNSTVTNCTFTANSADARGGGMWNDQSNPTLTNCTFTRNLAEKGGGMRNDDSSPTVTNCTFSDNTATVAGGGMWNGYGSNPSVTNCILWGDTPDEIFVYDSTPIVTYSNVEGGWTGDGNIEADPNFADGTARPWANSPCIDAGNNDAVPSGVTTDLDGNPRFVDFPGMDDTGSGTPPIVDMGAYEYPWADADEDGIEDSVDTEPFVDSNDFDDGLISGTILERADQLVVIADAPDPCGVRISASGGAEPAQVSVSGAAVFMLDAGDAVVVSSGSIHIAVVQGTVEIAFVAADGTEAQTILNEGNGIVFEPETCTITAPATNSEPVIVIVDGGEIILTPGQSKLVAKVDIDPDTLNLKSKGTWITCYIELPQGFDVGDIDVSMVTLNGIVPAELHPTAVGDCDGDGVADLMVKFDRSAAEATLEVGDAVQITLAGNLNDETEFEGCDTIRVIEPGGKEKK